MSLINCYRKCCEQHGRLGCLQRCLAPKTQPKPTTMRELIHRQTGCAYSNIHIGDAHFDTITLSRAEIFLAQDITNLQAYIAEKHDCENFAQRLAYFAHEYFLKQGLNAAFCEIWAPALINGEIVNHGYNGFVTPGQILRLIEPQTDLMYSIHDYLRGKPVFVLMR